MKTPELVVKELEANGRATAAQLRHRLGYKSDGSMFRLLQRMVRRGEIVRVEEPRKWVYYRVSGRE